MSLNQKLTALVQAIGADIKSLNASSGGAVQLKNHSVLTALLSPNNATVSILGTNARGSLSSWIVYSGVSDGKGFAAFSNGYWLLQPTSISPTNFSGTVGSVTLGGGGFANGVAFMFMATAGTLMGQYAVTNSATAPVFASLTHPAVSVQWMSVAYNAGVYLFVGKEGYITATKDFVTFQTWVIESGNYNLTDIAYSAIEGKFLVTGTPITATANTPRSGANSVYLAKITLDYDTGSFNASQIPVYTTNSEVVGTNSRIAIDTVYGDCILSMQDAAINVRSGRLLRYARANNNLSNMDIQTYYATAQSALQCIDSGNWHVTWNPVIDSFVIYPIKYRDYVTSNNYPLFVLGVTSSARLLPSDGPAVSSNASGGVFMYNDGNYATLRYVASNIRVVGCFGMSAVNVTSPTINGVALNTAYNTGTAVRNSMLAIADKSRLDPTIALNIFGDVLSNASTVNGHTLYSYNIAPNNLKGVVQAVSYGSQYPMTAIWTKGCVYFEFEVVSGTVDSQTMFGIADTKNTVSDIFANRNVGNTFSTSLIMSVFGGTVYGRVYVSANTSAIGASADGDVLCVAVDFDKGLLWIKRNNGDWNDNPQSDPVKRTFPVPFNTDSVPRISSFYICAAKPIVANYRFIPEHLKYSVPFGYRLPEKVLHATGYGVISPHDSGIIAPEQGQHLYCAAGVITNKFEYEASAQNTVLGAPDAFGVYTQVSKYWPSAIAGVSGNLFMTSVLSGGTAPYYTTRTETYYRRDGSVYGTAEYTLEYTDNVCTKETKR